jgi:acyl-CoA thioester hydrolase
MFTAETKIRIHYALTDQMGVVYHGNYIQLYEIARGEALRGIGFTYKDMEKAGIVLPVVEVNSKFLRPALYDDLITVKTILKELPVSHKIQFHHEVYNEAGKLLNIGEVKLYFMTYPGMQKCHMPADLYEVLKTYY